MATYTSKLGLKKPAESDFYNIADDNSNMDIIDNTIGAHTTTHIENAYSVNVTGLTALADGYPLTVKFDAASTGAITVNPSGLGAKAVVDYFGNPVTNVRANLIANLRYDATNGNFQLLGKGGGGNATADKIRAGYTATVDSGLITGTEPDNGAVTITPSLTDQTIAEGYHNGSGKVKRIADMFTYVTITASLTAPSSPATNDIWVKSATTASSVQFMNSQPSTYNGRVWVKISAEYLDIASTVNSNYITCNPRSVSRDYDINGGKASTNVRIMTSALYDLWVALGFVQQYNGSAWVYCPAYYWNGTAWVQHSWSDFYVYGGNPAYKIAPDQTKTTITSYTDGHITIMKTDPSGKIYVADTSTYVVKCYSNTGELLWTFTPTTNTTYLVRDICFDRDGNVYVMRGYSSSNCVAKLNASGVLIGEVSPFPSSASIRINHEGKLLSLQVAAGSSSYLRCYSPDWGTNTLGSIIWTATVGSNPSGANKLDTDINGNSYVTYDSSSSYKVSSDGATVTQISTSVASGGGLVVTPTKIYCVSYGSGSAVIKVFNYSLTQTYTITYTLTGYTCVHTVVDPDGYIYLLMIQGSSTATKLVKLPPDSNTPVWVIDITSTTNLSNNLYACIDVTPGRYSNFFSAW